MKGHQFLSMIFVAIWIGVLALAGMAIWNFELQPVITLDARTQFLSILFVKVVAITTALAFLHHSLVKSPKPNASIEKGVYSNSLMHML